MGYTLGLDLGTNSIGWACIDEAKIKLGVRIFQEGVDRDSKGKELSKNATRRNARQSRRQYARMQHRKKRLTSLLRLNGMMPHGETTEFFNIAPYDARRCGLDEKLSLHEFGRALFHLNQRRGFKSNRKQQSAKEDGVVLTKTTELQQKIDESGCRTLGEYLSKPDPADERIRGRYVLRSMVEHEFDVLWAQQAKHYPQLTDELKAKIRDEAVFFQRPLRSVAHLIGPCSLEPRKRRAKKESLEFQQFRILEQVNRLELTDTDTGEVIRFWRLPEEDFDAGVEQLREKLINALSTAKEVKFDRMRKLLGIAGTVRINLEIDKKSKLLGNRTGAELANKNIFGKSWYALKDDEKEKYLQTLSIAEDHDWLIAHAQGKWGLTPGQAERLSAVQFESGYGNYSKKAIRKLIPHLQQGLSLADAREAAGYEDRDTSRDFRKFMEDLRNPIVKQALHELAALMHSIFKTYGKPERIRVELARELKSSAQRRDEMLWENRERKAINDETRRKLEEMKIPVTGDAIIRYKLWDECKGQCPYTGNQIRIEALFSDSPIYQVEHIIPYPRSLDDSFMNKTLCHIKENQDKGNRTPYEFYGGTEKYEEIKSRAKKLPYAKYKRFLKKEVDNGFINRQLNDTAYISRMAKQLLEAMGHRVNVSKGGATASLRRLWGLNSLLGNSDLKSRDDHRHHAVDAAVIAMTDQNTLRLLSAYNKYERTPRKERFPEPWEGFRHSLAPHIDDILVSMRVNKRARGQLHKETVYGAVKGRDGDVKYAVRKPLESLTPAMVWKIADPRVRGEVLKHLRSLGVDTDNKKFTMPKGAFKDVKLYMPGGSDRQIKKVRIHQESGNMITLHGKGKTWVEPGKNHHVVICSYTDKKGRQKQDGTVCTLFEAARRKAAGKPVIQRELGPDKKFIFSLAINEMVVVYRDSPDEIDWNDKAYLHKNLYRVQKISNQITLRHHTVAVLQDEDKKEQGRLLPTLSSLNAYKVRVDRLGRLWVAND